MKKNKILLLGITFVVITMILFTRVQAGGDLFSELKPLLEAYQIIRNEYIEKVAPSKLVEGAIEGMISSLKDPHSQWMSAQEYKNISIEKEGFGGLGMEITVKDNFITIVSPLEDTPASRAGLQTGDKIIKINGESAIGITSSEAVSKLRGKIGTKVTITILREGEKEPLDFTLTRALIKLPNIKQRILDKDIGYIRIIGFMDESTSQDFKNSLLSLKSKGIKELILDLRNNTGGLLTQAVEVADEFISSGVIVSTRGRNSKQSQVYYAHPEGEALKIPLIVLINGGSASASEIVAGAIKDHKRGVLLGTKSFGKGTVQKVFPMENGGAIWITTDKYYTPLGVCIDGKGIKPNIKVEPFKPTQKEKEILNKLRSSNPIKEFLKQSPQWKKEDLPPLIQKLKEKEIIVEEELLERVLREEDENKENDIFNDLQLMQAESFLESLKILERG